MAEAAASKVNKTKLDKTKAVVFAERDSKRNQSRESRDYSGSKG